MTHNSIKDYMVQIREQQNETLTRKLHDVNIRLYNNNKEYRKIVKSIIDLMSQILFMDFEDYPSLKGISGANVGIPFNIVVIKINETTKQMLNPIITKKIGKGIRLTSNCGSLLLSKDLVVLRSETIEIAYYDLSGNKKIEKFSESDGGFTIQHEIEHNLGITLLNAKKEEDRLC